MFYSGTETHNDSTEELRRESNVKGSPEPKRRPHAFSQCTFLSKKITLKRAARKAGHKHTCDPDAGMPSEPNLRPRSQSPVRVPEGDEREDCSQSFLLSYFKHHDFILVCSEAAQMGRIDLCYHRKTRGPRFEAAYFSCLLGGRREAGTGTCEAAESTVFFAFCFSFLKPQRMAQTWPQFMEPNSRST